MNCVLMCGEGGGCGDEDVIHVDDDARAFLKVFDMQIPEDVVHHRLERAGRISQAEEHDKGFEEAVFRLKGSFFLVSRFDPNVIITPADVELREDVGVLHLTNQVWYERQWIAVTDRMFVQLAIILDGS